MFASNTDSFFNCQKCQKVIHEPVCLPCGETVCRSHSEDICSRKCPFCLKTHQPPEGGFPPNLIVQNMLMNKRSFVESKKLLEDLNMQFIEIETFRNDPEYYIDEYCRELTRQVDLRREQLFDTIRQYSNLLVLQINEWKRGLLTRAKEEGSMVAEEKLKMCKVRLGQLNSMFENFNMEEIKCKKKSTELAELLKSISEEYRRELLGRKTFELRTKDIIISIFCH